MTNMWSSTLCDLLKCVVVVFLCAVCIQTLVSLLLSQILRYSKGPIKGISFRLWGQSIRAFKLRTALFALKVDKIHFSWGRRFIITFQDVDIELIKRKSSQEKDKQSPSDGEPKSGKSLFEEEELRFSVGKRLLAILRWVLPLRVYVRNVIVILPDGSGVKVDLVSSAINEFSEKGINAEVFVHAANFLESGDTVHHIGYQFKANLTEEVDVTGRKKLLVIKKWLSFLRVAGVCIRLPDLLTRKSQPSSGDPAKVQSSLVEFEDILREKVARFKAPLKTLKVLDFKLENIFFVYNDIAQITISNAQVLLESVHFYSYGTNLEFLPTKTSAMSDHQVSITANSMVVEFKELSSLRVPLFNAIITTDCVSRLFINIPLSESKILSNINIINPTLVLTMSHMLGIATLINKYKDSNTKDMRKKQDDVNDENNNVCHDGVETADDDISIQRTKTVLILKEKLSVFPNVMVEFTISNLSATLQLSEKENLIFKLYNAHCLGYHQNDKKMFVSDSAFNDISSRPELQYSERDPFTQQLYNYLKITGAKLTFLRLPGAEGGPAVSIPICGFDRSDIFMDDISNFEFRVRGTLRHFSFTLDSLDVLNKITEALAKLNSVSQEGKPSSGLKNSLGRKKAKRPSFIFSWSVKLRLKDFSFSLLLATFLPRYLDPVEHDGINLTDLGRGLILLIDEVLLDIAPKEKDFKISTLSVIRIMEHGHERKVTDTVFGFEQLAITWNNENKGRIHLPCIRLKLDPNLLWFAFFIQKVFVSYLSPFKKHTTPTHEAHNASPSPSKKFDISLGKIIVDVTLPQNTVLLLSFRDIFFAAKDRSVKIGSITAFVKSVYVKHVDVHVSLLDIRDLEFKHDESDGKKAFDVSTSLIQFDTEYHYKFYTLLDNTISFFKSIKQMRMAFANLDKFHRLYPSQALPRDIPTIRLSAKRFGIKVKEDPFEQELGLILKVGVLEQRERLEKLREFDILKNRFAPPVEVQSAEGQPTEGDRADGNLLSGNQPYENQWIKDARRRLLENFSTSWIARYREARMTFLGLPSRVVKHQELGRTYYFFTVNEGTTVAELAVDNLDFNIGPPSFPLGQYSDFIYKYGKRVPKDTAYTLLIIAHLLIKTDLWELRTRDYPLPAISFPNTLTKGDVVFGEKMPDQFSLRSVYVPFVPSADADAYRQTNSIYGTHIIRTLNSIKTYFNITSSVHSVIPATLTWGKSLQPGYESLMLWFDVLSRPKEDPSPKLGFWDKCRYLFHGKWIYEFSDISGIQLNIKGSESPYKIADDGAGLTFFWSGGTILRIHGTSDPTEFLKIESKKFQLAVRDFTEHNKFEKVFMSLSGEVVWTLGLVFEEGNILDPGEFLRSVPSRPHFDIISRHPKDVPNPDEYDAFRGFRTAFIHMSLGVYSSKTNSSNSIYLAPHGVAHFLKWWSLFHTYTSGPIRQGPLFTNLQPNKAKFGKSLFTVKYQLCLEPLVFTHVYRHYSDFRGNGSVNFTGLKCKVKSLEIDLHQKRIKLLHTNEKLKKSKAIWSFKMSAGQIECAEADVRILSTVFDQSDVEKMATSKLGKQVKNESSEQKRPSVDKFPLDDSDWYDYQDYIDLDQVSLQSSPPLALEAVPLMYSPRVSYFRQINDSGYIVKYPFGDEESHHCMMGKDHSERTQEELARSRGREIEEDIQRLTAEIELMEKQHGKSQTYHSQYASVSQKLHEAKHRLFIIESILTDLKISADIPQSFHGDEGGEASVMSSTGKLTNSSAGGGGNSGPYDDSALLRIGTIETFRTMRCQSNVNLTSSYDNRFFVHNVQFKVNKKVRQHLIDYFTSAFERKSMQFFLTYKSVTLLNELLNTVIATPTSSSSQQDTPNSAPELSNAEFMERFDDLVREVPSGLFDYIDSYLIRLISPQLQLMSESEPNVAALMTARDIEVGIINVIQILDNAGERVPMDLNTLVEARLCVVSKDIQVFTLLKNDILAKGGEGFHRNGYGVEDKARLWPPWIPMEVCFEGSLLEEDVFLRRRSMYFMHTIPNPLFFSDKEISGFSGNPSSRLGFPGLLITSTSQQYCAVYNIVEDLLDFGASLDDKVAKLANVMLAEEVKYNLNKLDTSVVTNLQRKVKEQYYTREFLKLHSVSTFRKTAPVLTLQIQTTMLELFIIMTAIKKNYDSLVRGYKIGKRRHEWRVSSDELVWEMFDDGKKPFITIALGPSTYVRHEDLDGTNSNIIALSSIKCFNRQIDPVYVEIVAPLETDSHYSKKDPMVQIAWNLGPPVGGIGDLQKMVVTLQPFRFKIDHITADKILSYLFPKNDHQNAAVDSSSVNVSGSPTRQPAMATVLNSQGTRRSPSPSIELSGSLSNTSESIDGDDLSSTRSGSDLSSMRKKASKKIATHLFSQPDKNISEMVKRSSTYFNVGHVHINKLVMSVCYKGAHHLLTDVDNLTVRVPHLEYKHKLWSREEFLAALRRDITKVVLGHLGNIIGNKFIPHKKENKRKVSMDISQLLHWDNKTSGPSRRFSRESVTKDTVSNPSLADVESLDVTTDEEIGLGPFNPAED